MMDWWNRIRPDLLVSNTSDLRKIRSGGDVNERAWRLGNNGYVQKVRMVHDHVDDVEYLRFTGCCHAQMKPRDYKLQMGMLIQDRSVSVILESSCSCDAASEFGQNAVQMVVQ